MLQTAAQSSSFWLQSLCSCYWSLYSVVQWGKKNFFSQEVSRNKKGDLAHGKCSKTYPKQRSALGLMSIDSQFQEMHKNIDLSGFSKLVFQSGCFFFVVVVFSSFCFTFGEQILFKQRIRAACQAMIAITVVQSVMKMLLNEHSTYSWPLSWIPGRHHSFSRHIRIRVTVSFTPLLRGQQTWRRLSAIFQPRCAKNPPVLACKRLGWKWSSNKPRLHFQENCNNPHLCISEEHET